ncbi:hypothetical protein ACFYRN_28845 [Streptomyces sp. NPDC005227]|uniref:hypothetical protein n=1 Tax=Streptomyces sp. NPDC005227 TaxID=3364707 RepID=UPI0036845959
MRRKIAILVAAVVVAAGIAFTVWRVTTPTYDDMAKDCAHALAKHLPESKAEKPSACDGLKDDDYMALFMNQSMDNDGWLDEDGKLDERKMLEDTLDDQ